MPDNGQTFEANTAGSLFIDLIPVRDNQGMLGQDAFAVNCLPDKAIENFIDERMSSTPPKDVRTIISFQKHRLPFALGSLGGQVFCYPPFDLNRGVTYWHWARSLAALRIFGSYLALPEIFSHSHRALARCE
jgi:hypothetical protein